MIRFEIPKAYLPGFEILLSLKAEQVAQLSAFLKKIPVGTGPKTFGNLFTEEFKNQSELNSKLASTLYSLGSFKVDHAKTQVNDLIDGLTNSVREQSTNEYSVEQLDNFSHILTKLFESSWSLSTSFKAFSLLSENNCVFRENHIVTDVRLLFKEDLVDPERHGLIMHQLKLEVEENGEQKDYYFSLTISDLSKLQEQINRAVQKENLIRENYKQSISFITVTE